MFMVVIHVPAAIRLSLFFRETNTVDVNILTNPTTINTSGQPISDIPRVIINQDDDSDVFKDNPPSSLCVDNMKNRSEDRNLEKITVAPSSPIGVFMIIFLFINVRIIQDCVYSN